MAHGLQFNAGVRQVRRYRAPITLLLFAAALFLCGWASIPAAAEPSEKTVSSKALHLLGEILSIDLSKNQIVVRESTKDGSSKELSIQWNPATKFLVAGKPATAADLAVGDSAKLSYTSGDAKNLAGSISIIKAQKK